MNAHRVSEGNKALQPWPREGGSTIAFVRISEGLAQLLDLMAASSIVFDRAHLILSEDESCVASALLAMDLALWSAAEKLRNEVHELAADPDFNAGSRAKGEAA